MALSETLKSILRTVGKALLDGLVRKGEKKLGQTFGKGKK
jgi:hypothetical protein